METSNLRAELDAAVGQGFVRRTSRDGLTLYNYTDKCTYERAWTPAIRQARGLIFDECGWFAARPFPKFFNLHEPDCPPLPLEAGFEVQEKIDGSLGIWFWHERRWRCATRGSLSNQFIDYAEQFASLLDPFPKEWTVLTEIAMPAVQDGLRRAVAHEPGLYLLAARGRDSGYDYTYADMPPGWRGHAIRRATGSTIDDLQAKAAELCDTEGWVLRFNDADATRVKIKTAWYVRVARAVNNLTSQRVADLEAEDTSGQWLAAFPEELRAEAEALRAAVALRLAERLADLSNRTARLRDAYADRKSLALAIKDDADRGLLFGLLDGKHVRVRAALLTDDTYVRGGEAAEADAA